MGTLSLSTGLTLSDTNQGSITGDATTGWTFTPTADFNGTVSLSYSVTDGKDSTSATASFNVLAVNDAPELNSTGSAIDLGSVEEDLGYKGDEEDIIDQGTDALGLNPFVITEEQLLANFTDADDAIADLSVVNLIADSGTLTQTESGWEFIPSEDFVGNVNFSFSVTDGEASTPATAKLAVTNVNDDLYDDWGWVDTDITGGLEDEAIAISSEQLLDSIDYDENWNSDDLNISNMTITTAGAGEIVSDGDGGYTFNPADDFNGSVSFTYTVTDPEGSSVDVVRTIRVLAVNDAPELATGTASPFGNIDEDNTFSVTAADLLNGFSDAESTVAQLASTTSPSPQAPSVATPQPVGPTHLRPTSTVTSPSPTPSPTQTVHPHLPPTPSTLLPSTTLLSALALNSHSAASKKTTPSPSQQHSSWLVTPMPMETSSLVSGLTLSDTNQGTLTGDAATGWTFTPTADFNGTVSLNYSISDGQGATNSDTSVTNTFQVFSVNDAPVFDSQ